MVSAPLPSISSYSLCVETYIKSGIDIRSKNRATEPMRQYQHKKQRPVKDNSYAGRSEK
jgi:hypothetical protein